MRALIVTRDAANRLADAHPDSVLLYNPEYVLTKEHAIFAAVTAIKAMESGQNIANKLAVEFLVRLSAQKKIQKALQYGPKGIRDIAGIVVLDDSIDIGNVEEVPFEHNMETLCRKYQVSPETAVREIYEKMAMVDV